MAAPLPRFCGWLITRTVESPTAASTLSVPSDEPSSTTITSMSTGSSTARIRRMTSATVERSLNTGTITDSRRVLGGLDGLVRPRCRSSGVSHGYRSPRPRSPVSGRGSLSSHCRRPVGTVVDRRPDRWWRTTGLLGQDTPRCGPARPASAVVGSQPRAVRASVMSGRRRVGSSTGSGRWTIGEREPSSSTTVLASSRTVYSSGLPMLTGPVRSESNRATSPRTSSST